MINNENNEVTNRVLSNIKKSQIIVTLAFLVSVILFIVAYIVIGEWWYLLAAIVMIVANVFFILYVNNIKNKYLAKLKELEHKNEK